MAKAANTNKEAQSEQAETNVNVAAPEATAPAPEATRLPEEEGKMNLKKAQEVIAFYANHDIKGPTPKILVEARKFLEK